MDVTCCVLYERAAGFENCPRTPVPLLGPKRGQKPDHWHALVCIAVHMVSGTVLVLTARSCPNSSQAWLERAQGLRCCPKEHAWSPCKHCQCVPLQLLGTCVLDLIARGAVFSAT